MAVYLIVLLPVYTVLTTFWAVVATVGRGVRRPLPVVAAALLCPVAAYVVMVASAYIAADLLFLNDALMTALFGIVGCAYVVAAAAIVAWSHTAPVTDAIGFPVDPKHLSKSDSGVGPGPTGPIYCTDTDVLRCSRLVAKMGSTDKQP